VSRSYAGKICSEDISQAIFVDIFENPNSYRRAARSGALLFSAYKRAGIRHAQSEKFRYLHFSDNYMYSSEELQTILPEYFQALVEITELEESKIGFSDLMIDFITLDEGCSSLTAAQKRVLAKRYYENENLSRTEQNHHTKAIKILTQAVNGALNNQMTI